MTMKTTIYSKALWVAAITLLMASCDKEMIPTEDVDDGQLRIEVKHPSLTRATETAFEKGDVIGLFATEYTDGVATPLQISGNWANNVATAFDGSKWVPGKKVYWSDNTMDVYGYYPYMKPTSINEHLWSVQLDQSTAETADALSGYEASDFLWAKATGVCETDGAATLQFAHRCSKLVVKLVKGADSEGVFPSESELYIHNVVPTAVIDFTTGAVTKDMYSEPGTIKARRVDDETFEAIIVPQRIDTRRPFIEYIANGISFLLDDTFVFRAGKQHTINLTINANPDQIQVEIGGEIQGW